MSFKVILVELSRHVAILDIKNILKLVKITTNNKLTQVDFSLKLQINDNVLSFKRRYTYICGLIEMNYHYSHYYYCIPSG